LNAVIYVLDVIKSVALVLQLNSSLVYVAYVTVVNSGIFEIVSFWYII